MSGVDRSARGFDSIMAPATDVIPVTKSDGTDDAAGPFRGLLMDAAGAIKLHMVNGQDRTIASGALAAGIIHPIRFTRVWSTGTGSQTIYGIV
jgi:hypothetical protein